MHPTTAGVGWNLAAMVYDDGVEGIAVALFSRNAGELSLGFRWLYAGKSVELAGQHWPTPYFGKSSDWVLLPHAFSRPVARELIQRQAAGMKVEKQGFEQMVSWLRDQEDILPFMTY